MALDAWVAASIASIPESQRILVTAHDAFNYYARAYGLDVAGVQGISTVVEASVGDIRATVDVIVTREVPAIFVESSVNPRAIEAVQQAAADLGVTTEVGGELYSDAMGVVNTAQGIYIGMIHHNTVTITEAFGGDVSPLPDALLSWASDWGMN